ncbi:Diaminopimelate decarboxylase [Halotydeus destructor]|nr:Diaminopimelate decarboxylase [Halotydeus destructor]
MSSGGVAQAGPPETGVISSIRSMARRLSGTLISGGSGRMPVLPRGGREPVFTFEQVEGGGATSGSSELVVAGNSARELADKYGTPLYVLDAGRLVDSYQAHVSALARGFSTEAGLTLLYSVKANPSLGLLDTLHRLGCGFQAVSGGELARLRAVHPEGAELSRVVLAGPGKTREDVRAALEAHVACLNLESLDELELVEGVAREAGLVAPVAIRINPELRLGPGLELELGVANLDQRFKFGVPLSEVVQLSVRAKASAFLKVKGLAVHLNIASGTNLDPWIEARDKLLYIADTLRTDSRIWIEHISLGGAGFTLPQGLTGSELNAWVDRLTKPVAERGLRLFLDPGKQLVAEAGLLLTRVLSVKHVQLPAPGGSGSGTSSPRRGSLVAGSPPASPAAAALQQQQLFFAAEAAPAPPGGGGGSGANRLVRSFVTVDASGLADFSRQQHPVRIVSCSSSGDQQPPQRYDIVGPLDDLSDLLARDYGLEEAVKAGQLLAVAEVGAYCESLAAAAYCSRPRPAQVLVGLGPRRKLHQLVRRRDPQLDLQLESTLQLALPDEAAHDTHHEVDHEDQ